MFVPIPDIQLPNGGEIHANSTIDAEGNHAVVLHFSFPAAFPLDVVLPAGFHICKDIKVDAPADPFMPSPEVRAALRCWHGGASPSVVGYPGRDFPADAISRWVASWPDTA